MYKPKTTLTFLTAILSQILPRSVTKLQYLDPTPPACNNVDQPAANWVPTPCRLLTSWNPPPATRVYPVCNYTFNRPPAPKPLHRHGSTPASVATLDRGRHRPSTVYARLGKLDVNPIHKTHLPHSVPHAWGQSRYNRSIPREMLQPRWPSPSSTIHPRRVPSPSHATRPMARTESTANLSIC
jgi:hypothetical protein